MPDCGQAIELAMVDGVVDRDIGGRTGAAQARRLEFFKQVYSSEHLFLEGSSEAFGGFLKGAWLTRSDAIAYYKAIFVQYHLEQALQSGLLQGSYEAFLTKYGHQSAWFDTHARHSETSTLD